MVRVLLVHGLGRTALSMLPLAVHLQLQGHRLSFFSYCAAIERWEAIRLRLRRRLTELDSAGPDYVLVGHSP
jgi:predicted esterase